MKEAGILDVQLAGYIAGLRHKECLLVGDAGMPALKEIPVVDLMLCDGTPIFQQAVDAVLNGTVVEGCTFVTEAEEKSLAMVAHARDKLLGIPEQTIPRDELKRQTENIKSAVRTGEFTPHSNLTLQVGVILPD